MLFTDMRYLMSDDPTGEELKAFGDKTKQKYSWYFSHKHKGKNIRYFSMTRARSRNVIKYLSGNTTTKEPLRVFIVSRGWMNQYIKHGKIGKVDIRFDIHKIQAHKTHIRLFYIIFGIKVFFRDLKACKKAHYASYIHSLTGMNLKIVMTHYRVNAYIDHKEVELPQEAWDLVFRYRINKININ